VKSFCKHVLAAMNITLDASFTSRAVSYQRKIGECFFSYRNFLFIIATSDTNILPVSVHPASILLSVSLHILKFIDLPEIFNRISVENMKGGHHFEDLGLFGKVKGKAIPVTASGGP
jgi:hypothetical protein